MENFWYFFIFSLTFYSVVSVLLFVRSQHRYVVSRSPNILQIGHWANFSELISVLLIIFFTPQPDYTLWAYEGFMSTSHFLMVLCYILRAYRLKLVFKIDALNDNEGCEFSQMMHRVTQRWAVKIIVLATLPLVCTSFIIYIIIYITGNSFGIIVDGERSTILFMVDTFFTFSMQLTMIFMMNSIKSVVNEYQMLKEMLLVTILLSFTSLYTIFVHVISVDWLFSSVARNYLLMLTSSVFPIVMSYTKKGKLEIITLEMLESLELVLLNQESLNNFENFLTKYENGEGIAYLELYLSCECCLDTYSQELAEVIRVKIIENSVAINSVNVIKGIREKDIGKILEAIKETLELDYFMPFKGSAEFKQLQRTVIRQEILNNRLSQTSFLPKVNSMKNTMISLLRIES